MTTKVLKLSSHNETHMHFEAKSIMKYYCWGMAVIEPTWNLIRYEVYNISIPADGGFRQTVGPVCAVHYFKAHHPSVTVPHDLRLCGSIKYQGREPGFTAFEISAF
jgi:hypothetical protein